MKSWITLDTHGAPLKKPQLRMYDKPLARAHAEIQALHTSGAQGFLSLPSQPVDDLLALATDIRSRFSELLVIGIGGSDLGARTICEALAKEHEPLSVRFVGNPDPEAVHASLSAIRQWKKTAVVVVSKSGTTLETMALFLLVRDRLKKEVKKTYAAHLFCITEDSENSVLSQLAKKEGYTIIPHPKNVGGRYSVLSSVGLLPAACAGVEVKKLLKGAASVLQDHRREGWGSAAAQFAAIHFHALKKEGRGIHVLMPYAQLLAAFGDWYCQLWAESLGKKKGKGFVGATPVAALGAVDQHSQIQLYNEGPDDKLITFIRVARFRASLKVPKAFTDRKELRYMTGKSLEQIMHAELHGTKQALQKRGRPTLTLEIPSITPESLGALFLFYELATVYLGCLLGIDPFDQPGVEEGKRLSKKLLESL